MITERSKLKEVVKNPYGKQYVADLIARMGMEARFIDNPILRRTRIGLLPKLTSGAITERDIADLIRFLNSHSDGKES